jgi:hypothetical protein
VLHFLSDERAIPAMTAYRAVLAPGSMLAVSHISARPGREGEVTASAGVYQRITPGATVRTAEQIAAFFDGLTLVSPGLVPAQSWRPEPGDDAPEAGGGAQILAGVGRLPVAS